MIRPAMTSRLAYCAALLLFAPGCSKATQATRPDEATASEALGESERKCGEDGRAGEANPLVIDLSATERAKLEANMASGVAVVRYDCEGLAILRRCKVEGDYAYTPVSKKDAVIALKDQAALEANFSGDMAQIPVDATVRAKGGRALHLAYSVVGVESTSLLRVFRGQLEGQCDGATHFVFGTARGAFAMRTGSSAESYSAAQVFEFAGANVSTSAEKDTATSDGTLEACNKASREDRTLVSGCEALVRVELAPVDEGQGPTPGRSTPMVGRPDLRGCPSGFVFVDDACVQDAEGLKLAHLCEPTDFEGCMAQCQAGNEGSCGRLGRILGAQPGQLDGAVEAWRAFDTKANYPKTAGLLPMLRTACEHGEGGACYAGGLAALRREWSGGSPVTGEEQLWFNERGCEAGEPNSCFAFVPRTSSAPSERRAKWRELGERACRSGSPVSCLYYGWGQAGVWQGMAPDRGAAVSSLKRACEGGVWESCVSGLLLSQGSAACSATLQESTVSSDLFPTPGRFDSLSKLCSVGVDDAAGAKGFKELACRHGAPEALCR